ncbi:MAG TPA: class I SAM-dependent methyltransferase [Polyangiaceae bacterium]|nr:class I SAM-dependent methyltransferase [Polyangiaceae bacterium]
MFDRQARSFGSRAGLPESVRRAIAVAVREMGRLESGRLLDVGAGTGDVGLDLLLSGTAYTGIDVSPEMLAVFRERAAAAGASSPDLVVADATAPWPVPDGSVRAVFGSRSLHWIPASHLGAETVRVLEPNGALLVGRVVRDEAAPREVIRRYMRKLLREAGHENLRGGGRKREALDECVRRGGRLLPSRVVAEWAVRRTPRSSVEDWRDKEGLAGISLDRAQKERVLSEVLAFTARTFGNIDAPLEALERYVLDGVVFGDARRAP